jgi:hypothetical protein
MTLAIDTPAKTAATARPRSAGGTSPAAVGTTSAQKGTWLNAVATLDHSSTS